MSMRYTQSKSEAASHSQTLKEMLRRPENKSCADCKRNDPRWASTNLGCFMCIRCSGIHRGMGVHITRIKSVDLDTWTPEQIVQIQRWGNKRANAYWEAHLKPGHSPPEHKMESFIRSKYETGRWAMEGPIPEPESLDESRSSTPIPVTAAAPQSTTTRTAVPKASTSIDLLSDPPASTASTSRAAPSLQQITKATSTLSSGNGLLDLDFNATAPPPPPAVKRDTKADILSLFATAPKMTKPAPQLSSPSEMTSAFESLSFSSNAGNTSASAFANDWGRPAPIQVQQNSFSNFGGSSSIAAPKSAPPPSNDLFSSSMSSYPTPTAPLPLSSNPWGSPVVSNGPAEDLFGEFSTTTSSTNGGKKDSFSDIWS